MMLLFHQTAENFQTEVMALFSSFEDPSPVPKRLPQRCLPIDMDQEFEIRGYTMIFCGIPLMTYSNMYTIGNKQIVPSKIINKGAFFIYFELTEVGMFALYDLLKKHFTFLPPKPPKKHFTFLPPKPPKVCNYLSKYILTDACLNWENDFEKICQLLLYLDCAIVDCRRKEEEPYLSARMMRLNSNISFLRPESISELLGLSKCKIKFGIERSKLRKLFGKDNQEPEKLFSSSDNAENGKDIEKPERIIALIDRDPNLLDYYHEIVHEFTEDK
uniref:Uncharacterized protein n=1 Tax=Panagrolaimus sp. JU765 TaxID=591449 RepID=A0AC34RBL9_9BILA